MEGCWSTLLLVQCFENCLNNFGLKGWLMSPNHLRGVSRGGCNVKYLINLLPLSAGGGLQNACSFLSESTFGSECVVYSQNISSVISSMGNSRSSLKVFRKGWFSRLRAEWALSRECSDDFLRCFTFFGPPPMFGRRKLINVVGCAYSNLFYPELDFWDNHRGFGRFRRELGDWYRRWGLARADYWIFETEAIANRAINLFSFPRERVFVVRMAPSRLVTRPRGESKGMFAQIPEGKFVTLYLASAHPNKRIDKLIDVAVYLQKRDDKRFCFVVTLPEDSQESKILLDRMESLGVGEYFINVGRVRPEHVSSLIDRCDAMCNLARLESFSNNFVEAWAMRKALIVTDADWSRASCADGALYVDPEREESIVTALREMREDQELYETMIRRGAAVLDTYPSSKSKANEYIKIIGRSDLSKYTGKDVWGKK